MKLPVEWLREFVATPLSDNDLAERLTMAGLEVEDIADTEQGVVFHTKVLANRGDWTSIIGSAREAAAALDVPFLWRPAGLPDENNDASRWAGVLVTDPLLCPRYAGKIIRNIQLGPSPSWMQSRLIAAGMRPINVVVDVTNYVMWEMGQPLHAFDYDTLPEGKIVVRPANDGEQIITLDGAERDLDPSMLCICDRAHPIAIAGIMGGAETEVTESTRHIFLESAHFSAPSIRGTSKALGLSTEASYRFERFVDPDLVPSALERASELLADFAGGEVVLGRIDLYGHVFPPRVITLRPERVSAVIGIDLSADAAASALRRLGLKVDAAANPFQVTVPTFRQDLVQEIDLVEEVGRMVGYKTIPETIPRTQNVGADSPRGVFASRLRTLLAGLGMQEALTHSLTAPSPFINPAEAGRRVEIQQALSAELSGLRQSLLPNLLDALALNLRRRQHDIRLFEVGKVFALGDTPGEYKEPRVVAGVLTGSLFTRRWDGANVDTVNYHAVKGIVEALFAALHLPLATFMPERRNRMHPGRTAAINIGGEPVGFVAEVNPDAVRAHLDVPHSVGRIGVFELDADRLMTLASEVQRYETLPRFPSVTRDLAVVVDESVVYASIQEAARSGADPALLESIDLVSLFRSEKIGAGKKSVAIHFEFRSAERTLTDADIDTQVATILHGLERGVGAVQR